jgi:drug/metabolite transporter (DMT)-like permease
MNAKGIAAGLGAASIWGGLYVVSKVVLEVIPPFALLALRLVIAALVLGMPFILQKPKILLRKQWLECISIGLIGYGLSLGFQFIGTKMSTAANGAVITSATPAFIVIFAAWILGEAITRRQLGALVISTIGVFVVVDLGAARLSPQLFWGNLILVLAALTWALYSVLVRRATKGLDTLTVSFIAFLGGLMLALPLGAWEWAQQGIGEITPGIIAGVLYIGIISTALGAYLWNKAFELVEAGIASLTFFAQPLFGSILGAVFLGERITPTFILGGLLIGVGIWLAARVNPQVGVEYEVR